MEHSVVPGSRLLNHLRYNQEIDGIFQMTDYVYCEKEWNVVDVQRDFQRLKLI